MRLALFDLDDTLLEGDSDVAWCGLLSERGLADLSQVARFHAEYEAGTLDIDAFLRYQIGLLAQHPLGDLLVWRAELARRLEPRFTPFARELVASHAETGAQCALVTATNRFLVEPLAELLGLPHVIATEPEFADGRFTGRWLAPPCFREGKIVRVAQWLASRGQSWSDVAESWFYSDSHNDLPLLSRVTHPIAVRPCPKLARVARERGWRVLAER